MRVVWRKREALIRLWLLCIKVEAVVILRVEVQRRNRERVVSVQVVFLERESCRQRYDVHFVPDN